MKTVGRKQIDSVSRAMINGLEEAVNNCIEEMGEWGKCEEMLELADNWMGKRNRLARSVVDWKLVQDECRECKKKNRAHRFTTDWHKKIANCKFAVTSTWGGSFFEILSRSIVLTPNGPSTVLMTSPTTTPAIIDNWSGEFSGGFETCFSCFVLSTRFGRNKFSTAGAAAVAGQFYH